MINRIYDQYKKESYLDHEMMRDHLLSLIKYELATMEVTFKEASIMQAIKFRFLSKNNKTPNEINEDIESVKKLSL
jgi:hypothetical protein